MPRDFHQATAEQVILVSESVVSLGEADASSVGLFTDLPQNTAENALKLATDLGLLSDQAGRYKISSPLCRFLRTPQDGEKAAILRATIESYEPFLVFREELDATNNVTNAAQRTKIKLQLNCHREQIKETLLSLATYSGALTAGQGNTYERDAKGLTSVLDELAAGSREIADANQTVRAKLGMVAGQVDTDQVINPLVAGLRHAAAGNGREAVMQVGIATESFLAHTAAHHGVNIAGANGINAKMDRLVAAGHYPAKLQNICKYVGHIRNAADHGVDIDIGAAWDISSETGVNYVFVAIMLIRSILNHRSGNHQI